MEDCLTLLLFYDHKTQNDKYKNAFQFIMKHVTKTYIRNIQKKYIYTEMYIHKNVHT